MKRFIIIMAALLVCCSFAASLYAQMGEGKAPMCKGEDCMMGKMGGPKMGGMAMHHGGDRDIAPDQLASYDDKTRAAWKEIETMKIHKRTNAYLALASALAIGIAVLGGAFAQGKVAASAMEGIARNPEASTKIFTPLIVSLALIESLVIYSWIIALWLQVKM